MKNNIILLYNDYVMIYNNEKKIKKDWYYLEKFREVELILIEMESIAYYKMIDLDMLLERYKVIQLDSIYIYSYLYTLWRETNSEIIDVNNEELILIFNIQKDVQFKIYRLSNNFTSLEMKCIYSKTIHREVEYINKDLFINETNRILYDNRFLNMKICKIIIISNNMSLDIIGNQMKKIYGENIVNVSNYKLENVIEIYKKIAAREIKDPFIKDEIKYSEKNIYFIEKDKHLVLQELPLINSVDRLPYKNIIQINPSKSSESGSEFYIKVNNVISKIDLEFPFMYRYDNLKLDIYMDKFYRLSLDIKINDFFIKKINININININ